ncbi:MAG: hypothetical protein GKR95_00735 [Gammaproteobacteria bacterium]|nr:hypothetical protein [Gammaproteobacteria bacterium]
MTKKVFAMFASGAEISGTGFSNVYTKLLAELFSKFFAAMKYGGSNQGLMYQFASEFSDSGGQVIGIYPSWVVKEGIVADFSSAIEVDDLAERKVEIVKDVDAILCLPGGVGTLDELFTFMAQVHVGELGRSIPIFFYDYNGYYRPLELMFQVMAQSKALQANMFSLHFLETYESFEVTLRCLFGDDVN